MSRALSHLALFGLMVSLACIAPALAVKPNILMIIADDLGWNDVGYNNPDMITPNIDSLALNGLILNQSYVQPMCTPSRTAWMSGRYPYKLGMSHLAMDDEQEICLPLDTTLFPQVLKQHGYVTHMIGKWHLGFCNWKCTPTYRGFDSFYGFYSFGEDFYNKTVNGAYDFRFNREVHKEASGEYSTYQYVRRTKDIIEEHQKNNSNTPFYIYLPFQSVHEPLQVPKNYSDLYPNVQREDRRIYNGMVTAMDEAIGQVINILKVNGVYDNTIIYFSSDNGGWTAYGGSNWPLRGGKVSIFEGGTRVASFLHGPTFFQNRAGSRHDGMIHAVDWFPTFLEAVGIYYTDSKHDGVSQWQSLTTGSPSPRKHFIYNMDWDFMPLQGKVAIRVGDYKLIDGYPGLYQKWYQVNDTDQGLNYHSVDANALLSGQSSNGIAITDIIDPMNDYQYLFNLKDDPEERNNLYDQMPAKVKELRSKIDEYRQGYVAPIWPDADPESNPAHYGGHWSPGWC